jgi:hypothetical protein
MALRELGAVLVFVSMHRSIEYYSTICQLVFYNQGKKKVGF